MAAKPDHHTIEVERARAFTHAMRQTANCVSVVTTDGTSGCSGLTVSSMVSVSAEPPMLLVCIRKASPVHDMLRDNGRFIVNVLAAGQQRIADAFAGRGERPYRFDPADWAMSRVPELRQAAATFGCELDTVVPAGTHSVFIGRVIESRARGSSPLVYADRSYATVRRKTPTGTNSVLGRFRPAARLVSQSAIAGGNHE